MKKVLSILVVASLVINVFVCNTSYVIADDNEYNFNGHTYKFFDTKMTWNQAKETCEKMGGHLATFTSQEEWMYIYKYICDNEKQYWLGGNDADNEGEWVWITGENWNYSDWCNNEPNNDYGGTENYLGTYTSTYQWNDYRESEQLGFICEWDNSSINSSDLLTIQNFNKFLYPYTNFSSTDEYYEGAPNQDEIMIKTAFAILVKSPEVDWKVKKSKIDELSVGYFGREIANHQSVDLFIYDEINEEYEIIPTGGFGFGEVKEIKEISQIEDNTYKCIVNINRVVGYESDNNPLDIYDAEIIISINPSAIYGMNLLSYKRITSNSYYNYVEDVEKEITVILNGETLYFDQAPYIEKVGTNGITMVPMRPIFEAMGADVLWNNEYKSAFVKYGNKGLIFTLDSSKAYVIEENNGVLNWKSIMLDVPAKYVEDNINGSTFIPMRTLTESLGCKVDWDSTSMKANITYDINDKGDNLSDKAIEDINATYYAKISGDNPFKEYSDELINYISARNEYVDALAFGWTNLTYGIHKLFANADGYTNDVEYGKLALAKILAKIPDTPTETADTENITFSADVLSDGVSIATKYLGASSKETKLIEDSIDRIGKAIDWGAFTTEQIDYILKDYSKNIKYLEIIEKDCDDEFFNEVIDALMTEYTDKWYTTAINISEKAANGIIDGGMDASLGMYTYGLYPIAVYANDIVNEKIGLKHKSDEITNLYSVCCFIGQLDVMYNTNMKNLNGGTGRVDEFKVAFEINKASKLTAYECIKEFSSGDDKEIASQQYDNVNKMTYILWNDSKNGNSMGGR